MIVEKLLSITMILH